MKVAKKKAIDPIQGKNNRLARKSNRLGGRRDYSRMTATPARPCNTLVTPVTEAESGIER